MTWRAAASVRVTAMSVIGFRRVAAQRAVSWPCSRSTAALIASSARIEQWIFTGGSASSSAICVFLIVSGLVERLALDPLGDERARGDRRAAAVGLELARPRSGRSRGLTLICSFITSPQAGAPTMPVPTDVVALVEGADVAGILVVVDDFFAVCHGRTLLDSAVVAQCAAHWMVLMSMPSWNISHSGDSSRSLATRPSCVEIA